MKARTLVLAGLSAAALLLFAYVLRQLSFISLGLAANREVKSVLRQSLDDQKKLAKSDPERAAAYHRQFDEIRTLLNRMEILALTRNTLTRRFELVLLGIVGAIVAGGGAIYMIEQRKASHVMERQQRRVQYLEHLSSWQEAARRHAHEIRTPLTAAQLEVERLVRSIERRVPEASEELRAAEASILEELAHLRRFTGEFVSFARIGEPQLRNVDIVHLIDEFCATFASNWPNLIFHFDGGRDACPVQVDREMIRRVLVNLCTNSALAVGERGGTLRISVRCGATVAVDLADDGPGVAPELRSSLFEPYTTTRRIGEGMGLGLAISKKILLDHGGDLELVPSERGATFRMTLPRHREERA